MVKNKIKYRIEKLNKCTIRKMVLKGNIDCITVLETVHLLFKLLSYYTEAITAGLTLLIERHRLYFIPKCIILCT